MITDIGKKAAVSALAQVVLSGTSPNAGVDHVVRLAIEAYSCYHWFPAFLDKFRHETDRIDIQVMSGCGQDTGSDAGSAEACCSSNREAEFIRVVH